MLWCCSHGLEKKLHNPLFNVWTGLLKLCGKLHNIFYKIYFGKVSQLFSRDCLQYAYIFLDFLCKLTKPEADSIIFY